VNALWEQEFHVEKALLSILIYGAVLGVTLLYGSARVALTPPTAATVRVAGITVGHPRNYWDEIVDLNTPRDRTVALAPELTALEDKLFAQSEQAAQSGAKVIFWSEGDAILLPERQAGFVQRAQAFARDHQVYFVPATMTFRYGEATGDNQLLMIKPDGSIAFPYTKTMSWYPTDSDGVIHTVETPYGRIAASICFDMDFPNFIRQAAQQRADIMLVPAYDTFGTHPYHTEVGLLRAVEDGMAVMRQTNEGTSMAVDANGNLLAVQDFFTTQQPILIADLPTRGLRTLYGVLGDWLAYLAIGLSVGLLVAAVIRKPHSS
jgi:apolipoprotein N-acyltransferase